MNGQKNADSNSPPWRLRVSGGFFAFQEPIDEIEVIFCQLVGLFDHNRRPISCFKRKRFVGLALTHLISYIKQLLSLIAQPLVVLASITSTGPSGSVR